MKRIFICRVCVVAAALFLLPALRAQESAPETNQLVALGTLVDEALMRNPELRVAEASIAGAQGEVLTAKAYQNPEISFTPSAKHVSPDGGPNDTFFHGVIGVADPDGVEMSDTIITLKPREQWTTAQTKEELVEKIREKLEVIPGVNISFTQPIAMRVDEMVSGVKSTVAVKIFGDDLDVLRDKGDAVARVLSKVRGATDINAEKTSGLAYLDIEIDRDKIARYGINVADIQDVIETAIGGKEASKVYEGQKVFGLAVRFPESARDDVGSIQNILIASPTGALIPLGQLARVSVTEGPAQISREQAQRRIVIECNVIDRDLGGFVLEAKEKIDAAVKLPPGYFITWGGQFENQQRAMKRFSIVVPITIASIYHSPFFGKPFVTKIVWLSDK